MDFSCTLGWASLLFATINGPQTEEAPGIFERLDLTRPGLEAVREAVAAHDPERAGLALLDYYRQRTTPRWFFDRSARPGPDPDYDREPAERVLRREYVFVGQPGTLTHDIDWNADPVNDPEWPIELNRHYTWVTLGRAYWATHEERYAEDFVYQLRDWLADNPRPDNPRQARWTWRTLECGIRLSGSWPECFYLFLDSPAFTPDVLCALLQSLWEQADYLMQFHGGGNWFVAERNGLAVLSIVFPEFQDAPRWRETARTQLARELDAQVYPDGAQIELTPHYHGATLSSFRRVLEVAELNETPLPENYRRGVERMYAYFVDIVKPDGHIPMFNDSDFDDLHGWFRDGAARFGRPDLLYLATDGKEGTPPDHTSHAFRWAGQYVMRSGWDRDARYLALDAGPYGYGHQHEDKLQIDVYAYGRSLVVDPGRYTYAGGKWRTYFVSTASHSTLLVDGQGQQRHRTPRSLWVTDHPLPNRWLSTADFDFAVGSYEDGYGPNDDLLHVRKVFFAKPDYWIVHDLLLGREGYTGEHAASIQFQFARPGAIHEPATHAVRTANEDANLLVRPAPGPEVAVELHEGEEDPPRGWVGWSLHQAWKEAATMAVFTQRSPVPLAFDTVLFPYPGSNPPELRVERLPVTVHGQPVPPAQATALALHGEGWTDVYFCAHQPPQAVVFGDFTTDAEIVYLRGTRGDQPEKIVCVGGSFVRRGQETLATGDAPAAEEAREVDLTENELAVTSDAPVRAQVEYGYADGGGYLFATPLTEPLTATTLTLPDVRAGLTYRYRLLLTGADGTHRVAQQGQLRIALPGAFDFDDGTLQDWSGSNAALAEGYDGTPGALRLSADATTDVCYLQASRPVRFTLTPAFRLTFAYRAPFPDGGEWCYLKTTFRDRDGFDWSAYFAKEPSDEWQTITLTAADFRGDTKDTPEQQGQPLPSHLAVRNWSFILRKDQTAEPVSPELWVDAARMEGRGGR